MKPPSGRSFAFISGLMIGILSTLGLVFLLLNNLNPVNYNFHSPFGNNSDTIVDRTIKSGNRLNQQQINSLKTDNSQSITEKVSIPSENDSLLLVKENAEPDGQIIVQRDEMITIKTVEATQNSGKEQKQRAKNDSLLRQLTESSQTTENLRYKIEYWKSPVNFKGYRLIRNSLVIFGLDPDIPVSLQQNQEFLVLKYGNQSYKLIQNESFEPLPKPLVE